MTRQLQPWERLVKCPDCGEWVRESAPPDGGYCTGPCGRPLAVKRVINPCPPKALRQQEDKRQ